MTCKIHFAGSFTPDRVHAVWVDTRVALPKEVEEAIESAWLDGKRRLGDRLFDGRMARLDSWRIDGDQLHLQLSPTGYKHFFGTNLCHPEFADQYAPKVLSNPLGISALVQTCDDYLILGRRGDGVAFHAHRVHPLGGTVEHGHCDVFDEIRRELQEEAHLTESDLLDLRCVGLAEDPAIRQPELMFQARVKLPLGQINLDAAEHDAIWSVQAELRSAAEAMIDPQLTPIAWAALRLWHGAPTTH